jgi:dipeptidyl-peptidase III
VSDEFGTATSKIADVGHFASAAWHGTRIILRQVSPESIGIFDFIVKLYDSCSGNWKMLVEENGITVAECDAFLDYAATFLSNIGNYYVSTVVSKYITSLQT